MEPARLAARPGPIALRDQQDLMAHPFFSLAKTPRTRPIEHVAGAVRVRVESTGTAGLATIWDADLLIWATSELVEARDAGLRTPRTLCATPHRILTALRRGTSRRDYDRLRAALDRLAGTVVETNLRHPDRDGHYRFPWIERWTTTPDGLALVLPYWLHAGALDPARVLTLGSGYLGLTGGIERWLYRIARKHAGRQRTGWAFDLHRLHARSGSLANAAAFGRELRAIVRRQGLPGYRLAVERGADGRERLRVLPQRRG